MRKIPEFVEYVSSIVAEGCNDIEKQAVDLNPDGISMPYALYFGEIEQGKFFCLGCDLVDYKYPEYFLVIGADPEHIRKNLKYGSLQSPSFLKKNVEAMQIAERIPLWECPELER